MSSQPEQAALQAVLAERAKSLAQVSDAAGDREVEGEVVVIGVGHQLFGIPVSGTREILHVPPITPLPGLPAWLPGIVQVRGEVLSVVDLSRWFGTEQVLRGGGLLAVVETPSGGLGLLFDTVVAFRRIFVDELVDNAVSLAENARRPLRSRTKDLVAIFDLQRLGRSRDLMVSQSA